MSHLYALHPGTAITRDATPDLYAAAARTADYRLENGGAGTGWSRAWLINMSARLHRAEAVGEHINLFFQKSVASNLFDMHPPFQIDGNFGFTAGVAEALLQSHAGVIDLLPAIPSNWKTGHVSGLRARGDLTLDLAWEDGVLTGATVHAGSPGIHTFRYNDREATLELQAGRSTSVHNKLLGKAK